MGLFKRSAPAASATPPVPLSVRRAQKLAERGTPANAVITGMKFSLNDDMTREDYVVTALGTGARCAVRATTAVAHRLRLGLPVVMKDDGGRAVFDWDAMTAAWDLPDRYLGQDPLRKVPDDGIHDGALDARVQRHLRKWSPVTATVMSMTRTTMFGLQTVNFDIELELADGSHALSKRDNVPSYARWWAAPGAVVPAVVDPEDTTKANVDWRAFALSRVDDVGFDDDPIEGSIAAMLEQPAPSEPVAAAAPESRGPDAPVTLDVSMSSWVAARRGGHMSERDFEKTLHDWREAGMCDDRQVEAARAAARD